MLNNNPPMLAFVAFIGISGWIAFEINKNYSTSLAFEVMALASIFIACGHLLGVIIASVGFANSVVKIIAFFLSGILLSYVAIRGKTLEISENNAIKRLFVDISYCLEFFLMSVVLAGIIILQ